MHTLPKGSQFIQKINLQKIFKITALFSILGMPISSCNNDEEREREEEKSKEYQERVMQDRIQNGHMSYDDVSFAEKLKKEKEKATSNEIYTLKQKIDENFGKEIIICTWIWDDDEKNFGSTYLFSNEEYDTFYEEIKISAKNIVKKNILLDADIAEDILNQISNNPSGCSPSNGKYIEDAIKIYKTREKNEKIKK